MQFSSTSFARGREDVFDLALTDAGERYVVEIVIGVLNYTNAASADPDAVVTMSRSGLDAIVLGESTFGGLVEDGSATVKRRRRRLGISSAYSTRSNSGSTSSPRERVEHAQLCSEIGRDEAMSTTDKIHSAQDQVADLQSRLDDVQRMLDKAERVAAAGEAAKQRAQQLLVVSLALVAVGAVLLIWGGRRKRAS